MIEDLIRKNRSCRRFYENKAVPADTLRDLVNLARISASAANRQPLRYILCCERRTNEAIFDCLGWAAYLPDWPGPEKGERPAAYIVFLAEKDAGAHLFCDVGIAAWSILLRARENGLAGCMIASINLPKLKKALEIPAETEVPLVVALGAPKETAVIETVGPDGDVKYWRDQKGVHHVPKRRLEDVVAGCIE